MENKPPDPAIYKDENGEYCKIFLGGQENVFAKIDPENFNDISQYTWYLWKDINRPAAFYAQRKITKNKTEKMHRRIMNVPDNVLLDHKNGNGLENRKYNLRVATVSQNAWNQMPKKNRISKYKGVSKGKKRKNWRARITYQHHCIRLGYFKSNIVNGIDLGEIEAAKAYDKAAIKYFGSFACLNFPEQRNVVQLKDGTYKMSYIMSEQDVKNIEKKINDLRVLNIKEISDILANKDLDELVIMCHYFGCGISELASKIKHFAVKKPAFPLTNHQIV